MGAVVGERQRIDDAAAREGDPRLALEEGNFLGGANGQRMSAAAGKRASSRPATSAVVTGP